MRFTILIFALLAILSAFYFGQKVLSTEDQLLVIQEKKKAFRIPKISNLVEQDYPLFEEYSIISLDGLSLGKFPFSDTIEITDEDYDNLYSEVIDREKEELYNSNGLQVFVDPNTVIPEEMIGPFHIEQGSYFPVYLVNETTSIKSSFPQNTVDAIIEAVDSSGYYIYPIQMSVPIFCGTGKMSIPIYPQEMLVFAMPKFTGNFKTKMRVRVRIGHNIIVSDFFDGSINYDQFNLDPEDAYWDMEYIWKSPYAYAQQFFLGSMPKMYWDKLD